MTSCNKQVDHEFCFEVEDDSGNLIYHEMHSEVWSKSKFDSNYNLLYFENSRGYREESRYDAEGRRIHYENSNGVIFDEDVK